MDRTKKWRKILAMMLTIVMMLQNVQSVVWATGTDSSTQETTVEKKSDSEDDKTATDEEQTKEETSDKSSEELTDSEEKNTEETAAVLTSKASQSVTANTVGDVISYYANYRLDVTNTGNAAAEGVKVEITLPVKNVTVDTSKTYTTGYTENVNENDESVLTWENQGVATGETGTYMFSIQIPAGVTNLSDVNVAWYINGSKAEAEEWVAGSDETLAANVKADDSTGNDTDSNNSGESSGNNTGDNNQNSDNGDSGNNNENSDFANDADRIPDEQASQVLTYEGNGVDAKLLLVSEKASFPDGFSFQVNPVNAEQTEAYVQDAQKSGLNVNTGAFYDVQLLYNGVNASLTSAESMQLQVNFDSPVLTDVKNVTGVGVTNGDVSTDGVSGNTTSLTKTLTADSVGTVGVVALMSSDGNEGTAPVSKQVIYHGTAEDGTEVNVTMTGTDLPVANEVTVSVVRIENQVPESIKSKASTNPVWLSPSYKVVLTKNTDGTQISLNDATVELELAKQEQDRVSITQSEAMKVVAFDGLEGNTSTNESAEWNTSSTGENDPGIYIQDVIFENVTGSEVFGAAAYRRDAKEINLGSGNQITNESVFQWKEKGSSDDAWQDITSGEEIPRDADIQININYKVNEKALVKGDVLYFDLPENFKASNYSGQITEKDANGNWYTIANYSIEDVTLEGSKTVSRVKIIGTDDFYDQDTGVAYDVKGYISFLGSLQDIQSGSGDQKVDFKIGDIEVNFNVPKIPVVETNSLNVSKTVQDGLGQPDGKIETFDDMLVYTITISAPDTNKETFENVEVFDAVTEGKGYIKEFLSTWNGNDNETPINNLVTGFQNNTAGIYYQKTGQSTDGSSSTDNFSVRTTEIDQTINGLPTKFEISSLAPGETVTIKYAVKLKDSIIGLKDSDNGSDENTANHKITNKVTATVPDRNVRGEGGTTVSYQKTWVKKTYHIDNNTQISYTVEANSAPTINLNGWSFTDTLGTGQKYSNITVKWTDAQGTEHTEYWKENDAGSSTNFEVNDGHTTFTWPAKDGNYKYTFKYQVELIDPEHIQQYTNSIKLTGKYKTDDNFKHDFTTGTDTGTGDTSKYKQYKLDKRKTGVTIDPETGITTIQWKAEIQSPLEKHIIIPNNSVYTDTLVNTTGYLPQEMTNEQIQGIQIQAYNHASEKIEDLPNNLYTVEPVQTGNKITGFKITFGTNIEQSDYRTNVIITYSTKSSESLTGIEAGTYRNVAVFESSPGKKFGEQWNYKYTFKNLLNKEAVNGSYNCDPETGEKTIKWKLIVNAEGAQGMQNVDIKDVLPDCLEYVGLEDVKNSNIVKNETVTCDNSVASRPVFHINNCNTKMEFYVVTKITEALDDNTGHIYANNATLFINNLEYRTAQAEMKLDFKVLEKNITSSDVAQDGIISYELKINAAREKLLADIANGTLYVIDKMGENLKLLPGSFNVEVEGTTYDGCSIAPVEGDSTQFIIKGIPDGKYVRITYNVAAIDPNGKTNAYNKAELYCRGTKKAEVVEQKQITVKSANAGLSKGTNIYIIKSDKADYKPLENAVFEFGEVTQNVDGTFSYSKEKEGLKTNKNGFLFFSVDTLGHSLELNKLYYFAETNPPEGYEGDYTKNVFCVINSPVSDDQKIAGVTYLRSGAAINVFNEKDDNHISVTLNGKKTVENGTVSSDQPFHFEIEAKNGAPLQDIAGNAVTKCTYDNGSNGIVQFGPIRFVTSDLQGADSKDFEYTIKEQIPPKAENNKYQGIIYDPTTYRVKITVSKDTDRKLKYTCQVNEKDYTENSILFNNKYDSMTTFRFTGTKELIGKSLTDHMFGFRITGEGLDETVYNTQDPSTGKSNLIEFPTITVKNTDFETNETTKELTYVIQEVDSGNFENGIQYSSEQYTVKVLAKLNTTNREITVEQVTVQKTINGTDDGEGPKTINGTDGVYSLTGDKPTFTNTYGASGTMTVSGTKILKNKSTIAENAYEFVLTPDSTDAPVRTEAGLVSNKTLTATNDSRGQFKFDTLHYQLEDLDGANEKTFTYKIRENLDGTSNVVVNGVTTKVKDGVTYDTSEKTLKVTVKNQGNGQLLVTATLDGVPYAYTGNSSLLTFTNVFNASGKLELSGKKTLTGRTLENKQFLFDVYDVSNSLQEKIETDQKPVTQAVNDESGDFKFEIAYTLEDIADLTKLTRVYLVKEHDDGNHPGYTYDSTVYKVYVTLSEANGVITPTIVDIKVDENSVRDSLTNNVLTFNNKYSATGKFTPEISKRVYPNTRKQELEQSKFQFKMQGVKLDNNADFPTTEEGMKELNLDDATATTVSNKADGTVDFGSIEYVVDGTHSDTLGKYVYKISEVENSELKGYTFAKPIYAFVTVSDPGTGKLDIQVAYKSDDLKNSFVNATFINYYSGDGEIQFVGRKVLEGRTLEADQFSFSLEVAKTDGVSEPKETDYESLTTVKNDKDGIFTFDTLKFAHKTDSDDKTVYDVGTYYYRIKEVLGTKNPAGYTYSQDSYVIKVVVKDAPDGSNKLRVEATLNGRPYSEAVTETPIIFTNTYKASGSITLKGTKTLSGSPLVKDQFTFELLDQDQKTVLQTVKNTVDGNFAFQPLTYDQSLTAATGSAEKTYYVRETVTAAEKADGITYDSTLYKVTVTIKDKGDGTLSTSSKIQTVSGTTTKDATAIKFANTFAGTVSITKTAEDGKTPLPGAEFELYAAKANGSGYDLYGRYTSDSNGKISVSGLPANSYYFVESKAPDGYLIPKDANGNPVKYSFIIGVNAGAGKVANAVADFSQTVVNGKGYGTVELTKYNTAETKTLAGAQFALYDSNGKQVAVRRNEDGNYTYSLTASENTETTLVTGKDGKITITGLMWRSYYFQETTAPDGYVLSNDKISFKVDASSFDAKGNPVTIKTKATNKATSITIEKVDENGNALAGASMAIRDPQTRQIIETWTSTSEPHVIEGALAAGKTYYLSEQQAPNGYEIAAEQEFTVPADGKVTVTMTDKKSDGKEGSVTVTKKISLVDENANVVEAFAKDYTTYIGIFTDPAGEHPYGGAYLQTVQIHNGSSGSVSFTGLPKGTYYIFETDANGTPIAYDDFQTGDIGSFICTVEDGDATVNVKSKSDNSVTLNNVYYDFPDGFAYNGTINITKNVIKDGESADVDDTFYAGIFTKDANGTYVLLNGMVYELLQNDTITVDVPLGGEDGSEPVTYYVMETDETGTPIDKDVFAYEVSGEGTVSLDKDNLEGAITIVNTVDEEEQITPTPTPSTPSGNTTTTTSGGTTAQVHESDSKRVIGVKTGDNTPIGAYAAVLVIAALAIAGGIFYKKKRKNDK